MMMMRNEDEDEQGDDDFTDQDGDDVVNKYIIRGPIHTLGTGQQEALAFW